MSFRNALCLCLFLFALGTAAAQDQDVGKVDYQYFSDVAKSMSTSFFRVYYDPSADLVSLFFATGYGGGWLRFGADRLPGLRALLAKYLEWEKLAISNSVELHKPLPGSPLAVDALVETGGKRQAASSPLSLRAEFFSRSAHEHWLKLDSDAVSAASGTSFGVPLLYLTHAEAVALQNLVSEDSIAAKRKAAGEKAAVENLFN